MSGLLVLVIIIIVEKGTQWRRQFCLDAEGTVKPDEFCLFSGEVPLFETRECTMNQSCCEFGKLINME